jgi:hypothetical protein
MRDLSGRHEPAVRGHQARQQKIVLEKVLRRAHAAKTDLTLA